MRSVLFYTLILLLGMTSGYAQEKAATAPCSSAVYVKGQESGWYRLPVKQIPAYFKLRYQCRKVARSRPSLKTQIARGGENLHSMRPMTGWTSTHAAVTSLTVMIYYLQRNLK